MTGVQNPDSRLVLTREMVPGLAGVLVAGFTAVAVVPGTELAPRALVMAVGCGILAGVLTDWRAVGVVVLASAFALGGVLAAGAADPWSFAPIFAFAAVLGMGNRELRFGDRGRDRRCPGL